MTKPNKIAVIGVGKMGGGIARNLAADPTFGVTVFDLSAEAVQACVDGGARAADSTTAAVQDADLVITSLPMPRHVLDVYAEISPHLASDAICMDVSTIDPTTAQTLESVLSAAGHPFVTCLLGKGPSQAESGSLPLFVGGDTAAVDDLAEVFACIGDGAHRLGSVAAATTFKLVSNMIGMTNLAVLAEGYLLCRRAGVADEIFATALADTGAWSYQADLRLPWMMQGDYASRFPVTLGLKDVRLAVDIAGQWGLAAPVAAAGMSQLAATQMHGWGDLDVTAVLKVLDPRSEVIPRAE